MSDHIRIATLSAEIAQIQQEIEYRKLQEQAVQAELARAIDMLRQYTRRGQMPDPMAQAAVNNHSVALNQIRSVILQKRQQKAAAEREQEELLRRVRGYGY